jgi:hypothetical protein
LEKDEREIESKNSNATSFLYIPDWNEFNENNEDNEQFEIVKQSENALKEKEKEIADARIVNNY